jgi:uncharacterized protein (TIGR02646 family)
MIYVERTGKPDILVKNETKWLADLEAATTKEKREKAQEKYRHHMVQTALRRMFHGKCAFCESFIGHVTAEHIEHFFPKVTYPLRTFAWANFLLSCPHCNSDYKRDKFPLDAEGKPLLLNPTEDKPEEHLIFEYDKETRNALVKSKTLQGEKTIEILGLNREDEFDLLTHRNREVKKLAALAIAAYVQGVPEALEEMKEAILPHSQYSAFAIALVARFATE